VADGGIEALLEYRRKGFWESPHATAEFSLADSPIRKEE
jgi:hypothetical protein